MRAALLILLCAGLTHGAEKPRKKVGVCTGLDSCLVCSDCSRCKYCDPKNPKGGSCGTMRDQNGKQVAERLKKQARAGSRSHFR